MNKAQKIIWTAYLSLIIVGIIRTTCTGYNKDYLLWITLLFGWIPFLIAHFIWREKKHTSAD